MFLVGHFWSLCVEEHFYVLWPLFVFWQSRRTVMIAGAILMAVALIARASTGIFAEGVPVILQWNTVQKIDGLALGGILAAMLREPRLHVLLPTGPMLKNLTWTMFWVFVGLALVPRGFKDGPVKWIGETLIVLFFGALVLRSLECTQDGLLGRVLRSKLLTAFGKYSYGIYVIHGIARPVFTRLFDFSRLPQEHGLPILYVFVYIGLATAASFGIAFLSFHCFEKHFLALKRLFEYEPIAKARTVEVQNPLVP